MKVPFRIRIRAYDELPDDLAVTVTDAEQLLLRCVPPSRDCVGEVTSPYPAEPVTIHVRYRSARDEVLRDVETTLALPSDVEHVRVTLTFAEIVERDFVWLQQALIVRARTELPPLRLVRDEGWGVPRHRIHNDSDRTFWWAGGAGWQRWQQGSWVDLERRVSHCGMIGASQPIRPGESPLVRAELGVLDEDPLPAGRLRYVAPVAEVVRAGARVPRSEAMERSAEPMLVDVFTPVSELARAVPSG